MSKIIFITGATSGFGEATAEKFVANGFRVIINGRRSERLNALKKNLEEKYNSTVLALPFDVQNEQAVLDAVKTIPAEWQQIDILFNNAGLALGRDLFAEASMMDWNTMIDTNLKGLLYVTKAVLPFMTIRKKGHIINMGSVAAKDVYERGNVYCATKAAVDSISKGMRIDLLKYNIKVTAIHPGAAETEFSIVRFKGDEESAKKIYEGYQPLTATDVADVVYYCSTLPPHVCINDLVLSSTQQANAIYVNKVND
jgi:3-hydroxy acid dehydrogenase / malonic semialdehyde reductase